MRTELRGSTLILCAVLAVTAVSTLAAQSVTISPGYTSIGVGGTVQYTATVTGLTNTTVTWQVNGVNGGNTTNGKITTGGLYTAPATIPANGITVTALASDLKTSATVYVNVAPAGPAITSVSPNPILVGSYTITITGAGFQKGAIVRNTPSINLSTTYVSSTTLKASGYQGTTQAGLFQVINPGSLWGPVFSVPFTSGGTPKQTISPTTASVKLGATQQFTSSGATSWTATGGTVSSTGLFTAPTIMPGSSTVTVTVTGPNGSASATVTLIAGTPQTISPTTASVNLGATQQFTSAGATSWTATAGTVSTSGLSRRNY